MDPAIISTLAALAGTAIGALTTFGSTWMTTRAQARAARLEAERARRESLYGEYMDLLARIYAAALNQAGVDFDGLSRAYALRGRIGLHASDPVNEQAIKALKFIVDLALGPVRSEAETRALMDDEEADVIAAFARACRMELQRFHAL